jgi:hypothetical protein
MYRPIFNRVKRLIPKISKTEIIALKSGGTHIDRELFVGKIDYSKMFAPIHKFHVSPEMDSKNNK